MMRMRRNTVRILAVVSHQIVDKNQAGDAHWVRKVGQGVLDDSSLAGCKTLPILPGFPRSGRENASFRYVQKSR